MEESEVERGEDEGDERAGSTEDDAAADTTCCCVAEGSGGNCGNQRVGSVSVATAEEEADAGLLTVNCSPGDCCCCCSCV
jgi:hypothetical protein